MFHPLVAKDKIGFEYHFIRLAKQIVSGFRPKIDDGVNGLPPQLVSLIQMCWQTDPKKRPQSMADVLEVLKEIAFDENSETLLSCDDSSSTLSDDGFSNSPTPAADVSDAAASLSFETFLVNETPRVLSVDCQLPSTVAQTDPKLVPSSTSSPSKTSPKNYVSVSHPSYRTDGTISAVSGSSASTYAEEFPEIPKSSAQAQSGMTQKVQIIVLRLLSNVSADCDITGLGRTRLKCAGDTGKQFKHLIHSILTFAKLKYLFANLDSVFG